MIWTPTSDQKLEIRQALWEGQLVPSKTAGSLRTIYFGPGPSMALTIQKALEALRDCYRQRKATMDELFMAAKVCRVARVMQPYLESLA